MSSEALGEVARANGFEHSLQGGTDDEQGAYRWKPVHPDDLRFSIIAFWHPELNRVAYFKLYGLAFGFAPAVMIYNRDPELMVAATRCLLMTVSTHFMTITWFLTSHRPLEVGRLLTRGLSPRGQEA